MGNFKKDLDKSSNAFINIVWPSIKEMCGGGNIVSTESLVDSNLAKNLDLISGIDAWQIKDNEWLRGISSRVQFDTPYRSFTIRAKRKTGAKTELEKRREAIANPGHLFPFLTIQAYVIDDKLVYACVAKTCDLIASCIDEYAGYRYEKMTNKSDGNIFYTLWVPWLKFAGVKVKELIIDCVPKEARVKNILDIF